MIHNLSCWSIGSGNTLHALIGMHIPKIQTICLLKMFSFHTHEMTVCSTILWVHCLFLKSSNSQLSWVWHPGGGLSCCALQTWSDYFEDKTLYCSSHKPLSSYYWHLDSPITFNKYQLLLWGTFVISQTVVYKTMLLKYRIDH